MVDEQKVKIIVDHREFRNNTIKKLFELGVKIDTKVLDVGDYILSEEVVVELKKVNDFVNSLVDGRLFTQAKELVNNFKKPLYIIEGQVENIFEVRNVHPNAIRAALASLALDYQIPILFTHTEDETAEMLFVIAKREQIQDNKIVGLRGSRRTWSLAEQQQFFIEGLPLIGPKLAKNLLRAFGTPKKIINARDELLEKVNQMGPKKIEQLKRILEEEYSDEN